VSGFGILYLGESILVLARPTHITFNIINGNEMIVSDGLENETWDGNRDLDPISCLAFF
jgi:hypothetical protein